MVYPSGDDLKTAQYFDEALAYVRSLPAKPKVRGYIDACLFSMSHFLNLPRRDATASDAHPATHPPV